MRLFFQEDNILDLIYGLSIFKVVNNELEIRILILWMMC